MAFMQNMTVQEYLLSSVEKSFRLLVNANEIVLHPVDKILFDEKVYESIVDNQTYLQCVHKTIRMNSKRQELIKQYNKTRDLDML